MTLFRTQAVEHQRTRLYGAVTIHQPASMYTFTMVLVLGTIAGGAWLATGHYAQKELLEGWLAPKAGLAQVVAVRGGVANGVFVKVGDHVRPGTPLASFSMDVSGPRGGLAAQQRLQTEARIAEIDLQLAASSARTDTERQRAEDHARTGEKEARRLEDQLQLARQQLTMAERQENVVAPLVAKGFVSASEVDRRHQVVLNQRQTVLDIQRQIDRTLGEARDDRMEARSLSANGGIDAAQLRSTRAGLVQTLAELAVQEKTIVRSPIDGIVVAKNIDLGDTTNPTSPIFAIAPASGSLQIELIAPSRAIGFIKPGQKVHLRSDSFPSERFGTMNAIIVTVDRAPINPGQIIAPIDFKEPVYRLQARFTGSGLKAYNRAVDLKPGMAVNAYVATSRRTFLQWMIDPLLVSWSASR